MTIDFDNTERTVTSEDLRAELLRRRYLDLLKKPEMFPSRDNWEYIISHAMPGLGQELYCKYLVSVLMPAERRSVYHRCALEMFPRYLAVIPRAEALDTLYSDLETATDNTLDLIADGEFFSARHILRTFEAGLIEFETLGVLLETYQPEYTTADLRDMQTLLTRLSNLPELGERTVRSGMFGSERYICPRGHVNPGDAEYCRHGDCRMDIHGLTPEDTEALERYRNKVRALYQMLNLKPTTPSTDPTLPR